MGYTDVNDTTPIMTALAVLDLTDDEKLAVVALVGVRTLGDLRVVLERGDILDEAFAMLLRVAIETPDMLSEYRKSVMVKRRAGKSEA